MALCGWDVPDSKSPPSSNLFRVLGAMIDLRKTPLPPIIKLVDDRYEKLCRAVHSVLKAKALGAGLAGQLFGQFGFSCSQFFGRWGPFTLRLCRRRQHEPFRYGLYPQHKSALHWWMPNLHKTLPRQIFLPSDQRPLVISFSDGGDFFS